MAEANVTAEGSSDEETQWAALTSHDLEGGDWNLEPRHSRHSETEADEPYMGPMMFQRSAGVAFRARQSKGVAAQPDGEGLRHPLLGPRDGSGSEADATELSYHGWARHGKAMMYGIINSMVMVR